MATVAPQARATGLGRRLVDDGLIAEAAMLRATTAAQRSRTPLVNHLIEQEKLPARAIARSASVEFGVPLFDLGALDREALDTRLVTERLIRKHRVLPLSKRARRLFLAVSDPTDSRAIDEVRFHTGLHIEPVVVEDDKLGRLIEELLDARSDAAMDDIGDADLDGLELVAEADENTDPAELDIEDAPVVRYVNKLLVDAINKGASDLHFEPYEKRYRVRFRLDGVLQEIAAPPIGLAPRLAARIKVLARLDISERRVPQDGRIKLKLSRTRSVDFRVSTCPTVYGEKIVMRILDSSAARLNIEQLGYEPAQKDLFVSNLRKPYGMLLITGPTGSGKTVSLYTGLNMLNGAGVNISTAEDPVEIILDGINQVNVNPKTGLTFAAALRSFLRQDPDVILIGEVRDLETAEIAVKAAQTGHMVLATLHTNDAPQTITRLMNMGIPPYNVAAALNLIIAQRLVRRLCEHCKEPVEVPEEALRRSGFTEEDARGGATLHRARGCEHCVEGYKGRTGIYQVMPVSQELRKLILREATAIEIGEQASQEGVKDLRAAGLTKVLAGVTSLEEVDRVTLE